MVVRAGCDRAVCVVHGEVVLEQRPVQPWVFLREDGQRPERHLRRQRPVRKRNPPPTVSGQQPSLLPAPPPWPDRPPDPKPEDELAALREDLVRLRHAMNAELQDVRSRIEMFGLRLEEYHRAKSPEPSE